MSNVLRMVVLVLMVIAWAAAAVLLVIRAINVVAAYRRRIAKSN